MSAEPSLDDLISQLAQRAGDQSFFQAIRLILVQSRTTLGRDQSPSQDSIRLRPEASQAFPGSEVGAVLPGQPADARIKNSLATKPILEATFFGLYGPMGALPGHYTQLIIDRLRNKDHSLRDFLDLFNHRLLSLFYRAWEKHRFAVAFETASLASEPDQVTEALLSLTGFGNPSLRERQLVREPTWLHFAGIKALRGPRADALSNMLQFHFRLPVRVVPFHGEWLKIPRDQQTSLGTPRLGQSLSNQLGSEAVAGSQVWALEHRFRIQLGPLPIQTFRNYTPSGKNLLTLSQFVRTYVGPSFDFDVQVFLVRTEVPGTRLGSATGSRLGWDCWLGEYRSEDDPGDAVFVCEGLPHG